MSGAGPVLEPVASAASIMTRWIGLRGMRIEHRYNINSHVEPTHIVSPTHVSCFICIRLDNVHRMIYLNNCFEKASSCSRINCISFKL